MVRLNRTLCTAAVVAFCLFEISAPAWAQFDVVAKQSLPNLEFAIAAGDFNGDGKLDVAVAGNELMVLLGNGDGTFQKPTRYFTPGDSIAAADFNGDGILDLVVTNLGANSVSVLLGNGDGTFRTPIVSSTTALNSFLAVGDFNNDHKADVVVIDYPYVSVLLGNGDGTFQPPSDNGSFVGAHQLAVGDFNNDHRLDVLVDGYSFGFSGFGVLLGNGDGTLQPSLSYSVAVTPNSPAAVGDFDQDGNLDFAITLNGIAVFLGNGDGTFQPEVDYPIAGSIAHVVAADLNGDGKLDLIVPNDPPPAMAELLGNGDGTFQSAQFYDSGVGGGPVVGDFNRDGKLDLVLLHETLGVTTMLNTGVVRFSPSGPVVFPVQLISTTSAPQTVALTNTGTTALSIRSLTVTKGFGVTSSCGNSVAAGATCMLSVVCTPKTAGNHEGRVTLLDSASPKPQFILLHGMATPLILSPVQLNFGSQRVGTTSSPQLAKVTNPSNAAVTLDFIYIGGTNYKDFSINSETCSVQLAAGASCTVTITFTPTKTGNRIAGNYVTIIGGINPKPVRLVGTGTAPSSPAISIAPERKHFL
jgi:hypothetical protein